MKGGLVSGLSEIWQPWLMLSAVCRDYVETSLAHTEGLIIQGCSYSFHPATQNSMLTGRKSCSFIFFFFAFCRINYFEVTVLSVLKNIMIGLH